MDKGYRKMTDMKDAPIADVVNGKEVVDMDEITEAELEDEEADVKDKPKTIPADEDKSER